MDDTTKDVAQQVVREMSNRDRVLSLRITEGALFDALRREEVERQCRLGAGEAVDVIRRLRQSDTSRLELEGARRDLDAIEAALDGWRKQRRSNTVIAVKDLVEEIRVAKMAGEKTWAQLQAVREELERLIIIHAGCDSKKLRAEPHAQALPEPAPIASDKPAKPLPDVAQSAPEPNGDTVWPRSSSAWGTPGIEKRLEVLETRMKALESRPMPDPAKPGVAYRAATASKALPGPDLLNWCRV